MCSHPSASSTTPSVDESRATTVQQRERELTEELTAFKALQERKVEIEMAHLRQQQEQIVTNTLFEHERLIQDTIRRQQIEVEGLTRAQALRREEYNQQLQLQRSKELKRFEAVQKEQLLIAKRQVEGAGQPVVTKRLADVPSDDVALEVRQVLDALLEAVDRQLNSDSILSEEGPVRRQEDGREANSDLGGDGSLDTEEHLEAGALGGEEATANPSADDSTYAEKAVADFAFRWDSEPIVVGHVSDEQTAALLRDYPGISAFTEQNFDAECRALFMQCIRALIAQLLRDNEQSTSAQPYSRACRICCKQSPAKRAVFAQCGHTVCLACAWQIWYNTMDITDDEENFGQVEVACPFCRTKGHIVKMWE